MKTKKDRVIAIDYFRGVFILAVVLNHSMAFSMPFAYIAGAGNLWTSAAEMFLMLSGLTLWIVRGNQLKSEPVKITKKIWGRAGVIYLAYLIATFISLYIALLMTSHNISDTVPGILPTGNSFSIIFKTMTTQYLIGWAPFLMFYSCLLFVSPAILFLLNTKFWMAVPIISISIYSFSSLVVTNLGSHGFLAIWQLYFITGLLLGKFRIPILNKFSKLKQSSRNKLEKLILISASVIVALSLALNFNLYPMIANLCQQGWLPFKMLGVYIHLLLQKPALDHLFLANRTGILRPISSLIIFAAIYIIYQRYKSSLLKRTGGFMTVMGANTLWIFVAQAIAIPILAAVPLARTLLLNTLLTTTLILSMWAVTQRGLAKQAISNYINELSLSYYSAKESYLQRIEEENI